MKKIKYPFYSRILLNQDIQAFKNLSKTEKKNNFLNGLFVHFLIIVFFVWLIAIILLGKFNSNFITNKTASIVFRVFCYILAFPIAIIVTFVHIGLLRRFIPPTTPKRITAELIVKVTKPLRNYYSVSESDYITTKCYDCTNELFVGKDVILFFKDGKLRIVNDFYHSIKDLGCVELVEEEFSVSNKTADGRVMTTVETKDFFIKLGYRARTFIKKYYSENCAGETEHNV